MLKREGGAKSKVYLIEVDEATVLMAHLASNPLSRLGCLINPLNYMKGFSKQPNLLRGFDAKCTMSGDGNPLLLKKKRNCVSIKKRRLCR